MSPHTTTVTTPSPPRPSHRADSSTTAARGCERQSAMCFSTAVGGRSPALVRGSVSTAAAIARSTAPSTRQFCTSRPLMNSIGVPVSPTDIPSAMSACTACSVAGDVITRSNAAASYPIPVSAARSSASVNEPRREKSHRCIAQNPSLPRSIPAASAARAAQHAFGCMSRATFGLHMLENGKCFTLTATSGRPSISPSSNWSSWSQSGHW